MHTFFNTASTSYTVTRTLISYRRKRRRCISSHWAQFSSEQVSESLLELSLSELLSELSQAACPEAFVVGVESLSCFSSSSFPILGRFAEGSEMDS